DFQGLARIGMVNHGRSHQQWDPNGDRVPEAVEKRQNSQNSILGTWINRLDHRLDVSRQVPVTEHDSFGLASAAAGKDDGGQIIRDVLSEAKHPFVENKSR